MDTAGAWLRSGVYSTPGWWGTGLLPIPEEVIPAIDPPCTFTCEISSQSVHSVVLWRRKTPILPFSGLRHLVLSPIGNNLTKLNTGAQLQTFPYPTASKSFLFSKAFMAKSGAQSLTFKIVTGRQTKKKLNVFGHPGGG